MLDASGVVGSDFTLYIVGTNPREIFLPTKERYQFFFPRIFGPKRDEVSGKWRNLHKEELRDLYSSPSIIRIIKSRRMSWAGHVARMGEKRNACRLLVG
jgi:hypothetical protein